MKYDKLEESVIMALDDRNEPVTSEAIVVYAQACIYHFEDVIKLYRELEHKHRTRIQRSLVTDTAE